VDDREQFGHAGADSSAQPVKSLALGLRHEDSLLGNSLAEHLILGLEKFNLATELMRGRAGEQEQQWLKQPTHDRAILRISTQSEGDHFLHPGLRSWSIDQVLRRGLSVVGRQSLQLGDNCTVKP
jgi:hypothetical protein